MAITKEEISELFRETDRRMQETDRRMQETDRMLKETQQEVKELARVANRTSQKVNRTVQEVNRTSLEVNRTSREVQETSRAVREMNRVIGRLGNRLGEFVEEMVRPAAVRLFQQRGIAVHQVAQRLCLERNGYATEIDLMVVNDTDVVLIEVKSALSIQDINEHLDRLEHFKMLSPQYKDCRVMGAVAAMVLPEDAARYTYRKGLFVIGQSGETMMIRNDKTFKPAEW